MEILIAKSDTEIDACYPVMRELRPHLTEESFLAKVRMLEKSGYILAYLKESGCSVAVAGFRLVRIWHGVASYTSMTSQLYQARGPTGSAPRFFPGSLISLRKKAALNYTSIQEFKEKMRIGSMSERQCNWPATIFPNSSRLTRRSTGRAKSRAPVSNTLGISMTRKKPARFRLEGPITPTGEGNCLKCGIQKKLFAAQTNQGFVRLCRDCMRQASNRAKRKPKAAYEDAQKAKNAVDAVTHRVPGSYETGKKR